MRQFIDSPDIREADGRFPPHGGMTPDGRFSHPADFVDTPGFRASMGCVTLYADPWQVRFVFFLCFVCALCACALCVCALCVFE